MNRDTHYEDWLGLHTSMRVENHRAVHCIVIYGSFPSTLRDFYSFRMFVALLGPEQQYIGEVLEKCIQVWLQPHSQAIPLQFEPQDVGPLYKPVYVVNQYQGDQFINQQSSFTRFLTIMYTCITADFSCAGRLCVCTVVEHVPGTHDCCCAVC